MSEDFAWFRQHYKEFQQKYGDSFIVIKNKKILGVYNTYAEGVHATSKNEELGTFIVQQCAQDNEAYNCYIASMNFI